MNENELKELFKATNTEELLCGGWSGLRRFGLAVAEAEREACAKKVRALAPPFEQTRHGTTDYERGVLDAVDAIVLGPNV